MKIPASKVPAQVWAEKAKIKKDLGEDERSLLSLWEGSKQVYRVSTELWNELAITEFDEVPVEVFEQLPYTCLFIQKQCSTEYSQIMTKNTALVWGENVSEVEEHHYGCFVWVKDGSLFMGELHDLKLHHTENYAESDRNKTVSVGMLVKVSEIPLSEKKLTLSEWLNQEESRVSREQKMLIDEGIIDGAEVDDEVIWNTAHDSDFFLKRAIGFLLYVHSKDADVQTVYVPQKNRPRKSRQTDCTVHEVGFRIAPKLSEVRRVYEDEKRKAARTGRRMPVHVRRAHWHGYWTGARDNPTGLEIKWIAPIVVNAALGEVEGVIHDFSE